MPIKLYQPVPMTDGSIPIYQGRGPRAVSHITVRHGEEPQKSEEPLTEAKETSGDAKNVML